MHGILNDRITVFASREISELATFMRDNGGWDYEYASRYFKNTYNDGSAFAELGMKKFIAFKTDNFSEYPSDWRMIHSLYSSLADILVPEFESGAPTWIASGAGELIAGMAMAYTDDSPYEHSVWRREDALSSSSRLDSRAMIREGLRPALEATELLVYGAGLRDLVIFLDRVIASNEWQRTFEDTFGISVEGFYDLYEVHWNNGLPNLAIPLEPSETLTWPKPESLPRVHSVNSLKPIVAAGIARITTQGRIGSGFVYRVEDDGTVWILTHDYLAGSEDNTTVRVSFANVERVITGNVHAVHEEKPLAIMTACCFSSAVALPVALNRLDFGVPIVIALGFREQNNLPLELIGTSGELIGYRPDFSDGRFWELGDALDMPSVGSPVFNGVGQVVGVVLDEDDDVNYFVDAADEHWLIEVNSQSLPLSDWIDDSHRLESLKKYDASPALPSYLELVHDPDLRTREANAIKIGANHFHNFAVALNLPLPNETITVYTHNDPSVLTEHYESEEGFTRPFGRSQSGLATENAVYMRALEPDTRPKLRDLDTRPGLLGHELTHTMFQFRLTDGPWRAWMAEGMAVYFSILFEAHSENRSLSTARQDFRGFFESIDLIPPSSDNEFYRFPESNRQCNYLCGHAAMELLASRVGIRGLVSFFENSRAGTPWQTTFEQTFGLTVAEFYDLFDQHIQAGFPVLQIPDDPFPEN